MVFVLELCMLSKPFFGRRWLLQIVDFYERDSSAARQQHFNVTRDTAAPELDDP
jgi:hypothetical protein